MGLFRSYPISEVLPIDQNKFYEKKVLIVLLTTNTKSIVYHCKLNCLGKNLYVRFYIAYVCFF